MYNLNDIATMTGLSTRTLRNYLKNGFLEGEKIEGIWQFTEENFYAFLSHEAVKPALQAKKNALVYDFMADRKKTSNELCIILDLCADQEEAAEVSNTFCNAVNSCQPSSNIRFAFESRNGHVRVIVTGSEDTVLDVLHAYYG